MRRFEYVAGKSSKFWCVAVDGGEVLLHWGRTGTAGQHKTRSFASAAAAAAEADKQIRAKLQKGYVEVSAETSSAESPQEASGPETPPEPEIQVEVAEALLAPGDAPLPDEDKLVIPEGWARKIPPRRGGVFVPARVEPNAAKAMAEIRKCWEAVAGALGSGEKDGEGTELALAAVSFMSRGEPNDARTLGAVAAVVGDHLAYGQKPVATPVADYLVAERGLVFATQAALHRVALRANRLTMELRPAEHSGRDDDDARLGLLKRLRRLLVQASEEDYLAARDAARPLRGTPMQHVAASFLFPTETGWLGEALRHLAFVGNQRLWLLSCVSDEATAREVLGDASMWNLEAEASHVPSFVEGMGTAATPLLAGLIDEQYKERDWFRVVAEGLAAIPSDEAFTALLDHADSRFFRPSLTVAATTFPQRAVRLLAGSRASEARALLASVIRQRPEVVAAVWPSLDAAAQQEIVKLRESEPDVPDAPREAWPAVLADPPWLRAKKRKAPKPKIVEVAPLPREDHMLWEPAQRAEWRGSFEPSSRVVDEWGKLDADGWAKVKPVYHEGGAYVALAPEALALAYLRDRHVLHVEWWQKVFVARFELEVLPTMRSLAEAHPNEASYACLLPFAATSLAPLMSEANGRLKSVRKLARAWLRRHAGTACLGLVPAAVGPEGKPRDWAIEALGYLVMHDRRAIVAEVASRYGEAVVEALQPVLELEPLEQLPKKVPTVDERYDATALPQVLLRNREMALPGEAAGHLLTMLAFSEMAEPYAGIAQVREACDPASLARFGWALFQRWLATGAGSKEQWAFRALGLIGDDECADQLAPLLRAWPGESQHARAVVGLDVLAAIGSDVALMHLNGIAQKLKFKGLQDQARAKIAEIAEARGMTGDELADRLVPDLGLDSRGSLELDYGPRKFTLGFDEQLQPYVLDEANKRLAKLPKPGKRDDPALAPEAYERFTRLKKDARSVSKQQVLRMELSMCAQRRWEAAVFRRFMVDHPLLIHVVRRLIWAVYDGDRLVQTFRVAEDRSFADAKDEAWTLDDGATVGIPHPIELDEVTTAAWGEVFADYELLQPFPQLGRDVYARQPGEGESKELDRVQGREVATGKVLGLTTRDWRRGPAQDAGFVCWMEKPLPGGLTASLPLDPGIVTGNVDMYPELTLGAVTLSREAGWEPHGDLAFGMLPDAAFSELVRDLTHLAD